MCASVAVDTASMESWEKLALSTTAPRSFCRAPLQHLGSGGCQQHVLEGHTDLMTSPCYCFPAGETLGKVVAISEPGGRV